MSAWGDAVVLDKPGDEYFAERVVERRGKRDKSLSILVAEMVATFGPNWETIRELVRQAAVMTPEQGERLGEARDAVPRGEWDVAWFAAWRAARETDRGDAWGAVWEVAGRAAWAVGDGQHAARCAVAALVVRDLVGRHGLTQEHVDLLFGPWAEVMGDPRGGDSIAKVVSEVLDELKSAQRKHPGWPEDPVHATALVSEEVGEATWEINSATYKGDSAGLERARAEMVQVAAVALLWIANFDRYKIRPSDRGV